VPAWKINMPKENLQKEETFARSDDLLLSPWLVKGSSLEETGARSMLNVTSMLRMNGYIYPNEIEGLNSKLKPRGLEIISGDGGAFMTAAVSKDANTAIQYFLTKIK